MFPLQMAMLLSEPVMPFSSDAFILIEQQPRRPSRTQTMPALRTDPQRACGVCCATA